jgi:hypothetical protein
MVSRRFIRDFTELPSFKPAQDDMFWLHPATFTVATYQVQAHLHLLAVGTISGCLWQLPDALTAVIYLAETNTGAQTRQQRIISYEGLTLSVRNPLNETATWRCERCDRILYFLS